MELRAGSMGVGHAEKQMDAPMSAFGLFSHAPDGPPLPFYCGSPKYRKYTSIQASQGVR